MVFVVSCIVAVRYFVGRHMIWVDPPSRQAFYGVYMHDLRL